MLSAAGLEVIAHASARDMPPRRFSCAVSADESIDAEPAVFIASPLQPVGDDRIRITRPVDERELLDAVSAAIGLTREKPPAMNMRRRATEAGLTVSRCVTDAGLHVLVAEDEVVSQEFAAEALRRLMHRVTIVGDGEEAL